MGIRRADRSCGRLRHRFLPGDELGQSEIEQLRLIAIRRKDICRLDVSMNDPASVRRVERVSDLDRQVEEFLQLDARAVLMPIEVLASLNSIAMKFWPLASPIS